MTVPAEPGWRRGRASADYNIPARRRELSVDRTAYISICRICDSCMLGLPNLVEEIQIAAHHGRIVHVGDAVPTIRLQAGKPAPCRRQ